MSDRLDVLKQRLAQLSDVAHAMALAHWDQQTMMPPRGGEARAESLATLTSITHEMFVDDETGRLLEAAGAELNGAGERDPDSDDARLIRLVGRQWDKARRVPTELAAELARAASVGQEAWIVARANSDFASFAPYLEHNFELARRYVDCHMSSGEFACAYDVLLDDYEPRMPTTEVRDLFDRLKAELVPLIAAVTGADPVDDAPVHAEFPVAAQRRLVRDVVTLMGFDDAGWRIDDTVHPFATRIGGGDVRITTRWDERFFPMGLYGAMHECGHGLYEAGLPPALRRSPLGTAESLGLHESQSRMWENMVGRGRPFATVLAPRIAELAGGELAGLDAEGLYRAVNAVRPSFIRVEADEATYALHIILRFELEQELIDGTLTVKELPEAWNARFEDYFGLKVTNDADGVLQDVHWSAGLIGYFPTYALGNLIAGQLWERARAELSGLDGEIAAGELGSLREWLRQRVHRHGSKFTTKELLTREAGGPVSVTPFTNYLKAKLGDVYGIDLSGQATSER
ncbi:MAG TPA: carboxypeptidase M32 [Solirubrobacteraceae bacterium]|jgi:carboxypeptidase Taq|nr:carboxypeptidase M32 [Solirubrobacteraceae bacterium]